MRFTINDLSYEGRYHDCFWNKDYNKNADITNGLANCTTAVIGFCLAENNPLPVSRIVPASEWHNYLTNDWKKIPFELDKVKVGDIIQWVDKCHVAKVADIVDGKVYVNASFYTGEHGKSIYNGEYDTRPWTSLKEMSDWMIANYPTRFFHCWDLEKESQMVGGVPEHILVLPNTIVPVEKDSSKNQVETTDNTLRIRTEPNLNSKIVGHVSVGYYDVIKTKEATEEDRMREPSLKCWYEISKGRWIGNVTTIYHEKSDAEDWEKELKSFLQKITDKTKAVTNERDAYKEKLRKIHELSEVD